MRSSSFNCFNNIKRIRKVFSKGDKLTLSKLSKFTKIKKDLLLYYFKNQLFEVIRKENKKYYIISRLSKYESDFVKYLKAVEKGKELRVLGFSYAEIVSILKEDFDVLISQSTSFGLFKSVRMSVKGKKRYEIKNRSNKLKAGHLGGLKVAKSGHLARIRKKAVKIAAEKNLIKLLKSSEKLNLNKIRIISHCFFDGCVYTGKGKYVSYCNMSQFLIDQFKEDMLKVYGLYPSDERIGKNNIFQIKYCSTNLVNDLLRYSPSFSTSVSNAKIPDEIMNTSKKFKRVFLRAFWDDEGAVRFDVKKQDKYYKRTKSVEAFCNSRIVRKQLIQLHLDLGINCRENGGKICIYSDDLLKFKNLINFSHDLFVSRRSMWKGVEKNYILERAFSEPYKVYCESYGCTASQADFERILGLLIKGGFVVCDYPEESDFILVNTCTVKGTTENRMFSRFDKLSRINDNLIITGCLPKVNIKRIRNQFPNFKALIDSYSFDKILNVVYKIEKGESRIIEFSEPNKEIFNLPVYSNKKLTGIVPISYGCLGNCAFCCVKQARGNLVSVPISSIFNYVKKLIESGKKEILITSQDTGCYGADLNENLFDLIKKITKINGDFRIRIGMANPHFVLNKKEKWVEMLNNEKVFSFIHIPIQSGSNKILKKMNRIGTAEQFEELVDFLKKNVKDLTIMTDIIVGFPGETEGDFEKTIKLIEKTKSDIVNISMFYPRPKTKASLMKKIPTEISKQRTRRLTKIIKKISFEQNEKLINNKIECLVTGILEDGKTHCRAFNYKQIILPSKEKDFIKAKVINVTSHYLIGNIIK